jgi:hypothetical protein
MDETRGDAAKSRDTGNILVEKPYGIVSHSANLCEEEGNDVRKDIKR